VSQLALLSKQASAIVRGAPHLAREQKMELKFIFGDLDDLTGQMRKVLDRIEKRRVAAAAESSDQAAMREVLAGLSDNARKITTACAKSPGTTSSKTIGALIGGVEGLRGVNSQISALAKKKGLNYSDLFTRTYPRSGGTDYALTPSFRAVVASAGVQQSPTP
jgi:hypothetical protein